MPSESKGYVDRTYLDRAAKEVKGLNSFKQLSHERMHIQPGHKVLDVGCGPATDTISLAQRVGLSGRVIGVDYDAEMIAEAERRALEAGVSDRVTHQRADVNELPFESNSFDASRAERLFIHMLDPAKALSEIARVTKPGGWIVILESDFGTLSIDTSEIEIERRLARCFAQHMVNNGYSGRQLYRLFKQRGLTDVTVHVCGTSITDYALARQMWLMDKLESEALAAGVVTVPELDRLRKDWERADAESTFFTSLAMMLASGRKP